MKLRDAIRLATGGLTMVKGCMLPYPGFPGATLQPNPTARVVSVPYELPANTTVIFDDPSPGSSSGLHAGFGWPTGIPETYRIVFTVPGSFTFHGFDALGPAGTVIATYAIVTQGMSVPLRSLTHDTAYVDLYQDGSYGPGVDPLLEYLGDGKFRLTLPNGGDDLALSITAGFAASGTFQLLAGLVGNPPEAGEYELQAAFTSVDPDNGDADDGAGTAPSTFDAIRTVAFSCTADAQCDDGDDCTVDACGGGSCTHDGGAPAAHLDCALGQLLDAQICAPDPILPSFAKFVGKKVAAARSTVGKLDGASAKKQKRLVMRIRKALDTIERKAQRNRKLADGCKVAFPEAVGARRLLVDALSPP